MKSNLRLSLAFATMLSSSIIFAACPFNNKPNIEGYWIGSNDAGSASGTVTFSGANYGQDKFQATAHIDTGKCVSGECDLLPYIIGSSHEVKGTCDADGNLKSVIFDGKNAKWVDKRHFSSKLAGDVVFVAGLTY